jgi:hypothetical protein
MIDIISTHIGANRQARAYVMRQHALGPHGDFHGWRLARLLRDATTRLQAAAAERELGLWLRARGLALAPAA